MKIDFSTMKKFIQQVLPGTTIKQKIIVIYFVFSFMSLFAIGNMFILIPIIMNFANASRLMKRIPIPED